MARILFAQEIYFPFQSTGKLSAYLKKAGHRVELVIGDEEKIVSHIKSTHPDLIAFSVLTPYRNHMLRTVHAIKQAGIKIPVIAGGYDVTFLPELVEKTGLDIVCRGEGEEALAELADRIDRGESFHDIKNLWVKSGSEIFKNRMRPWRDNLDTLPFEDRDIYLNYDSYFKIVPFMQVLAGRGCPYLCSYCFNHGYRKLYEQEGSRGYCRLRSVPHLIAELEILKHKYNARYIFFNDSTLTYNKKWLFEFLEEYRKKIALPFSINSVAREMDEEIAKELATGGYCKLVRFGMETGDEKFRFEVLNRKITDEELLRAASLLARYRVRYSIAMMFGLPGETVERAWKTIELAEKLSVRGTVHAVNIFKPFPGLDITEYGIKLGQYSPREIQVRDIPECGEKSGASSLAKLPLGSRELCYYENMRIDPEGRIISRLSRFSHIAIRYPFLRPLIRLLIKLPDNPLYRAIWFLTEALLNIRVHAGATPSFFIKYFLFHRGKKIR